MCDLLAFELESGGQFTYDQICSFKSSNFMLGADICLRGVEIFLFFLSER